MTKGISDAKERHVKHDRFSGDGHGNIFLLNLHTLALQRVSPLGDPDLKEEIMTVFLGKPYVLLHGHWEKE